MKFSVDTESTKAKQDSWSDLKFTVTELKKSPGKESVRPKVISLLLPRPLRFFQSYSKDVAPRSNDQFVSFHQTCATQYTFILNNSVYCFHFIYCDVLTVKSLQ